MFCGFEIAVYLPLRERICSPKEFAPLRILNLLLKEFALLRIFCRFFVYINKLFTPFRTYRRKRMSMNARAGTRNFFLFIEVLEKFQVVCGTFWIELYLAYHRTFGIFLTRAGI